MTGAVQRVVRDIIDPYHLRFSPDMKWFVTAANRLNHIDIYRWSGLQAAEPLTLAARVPAARTPVALDARQWARTASSVSAGSARIASMAA